MKQKKVIEKQIFITDNFRGKRLDFTLAKLLPEYSRGVLQEWIKSGAILVCGKQVKPTYRVQGDEAVIICATVTDEVTWEPQPLNLDVLYSDEYIIILNKPAGLVTHPAPGNATGTLANALLYHYPELAQIPRAGIVHRLDKDTTGLMAVARNLQAHHALVEQLQSRDVKRQYLALVQGEMISGGEIKTAFGRHPQNRLKMAVVKNGKEAITQYRIEKKYHGYTLLRINLKTGRTHQIRVHMQHLGYPLVGDKVYGEPKRLAKDLSERVREALLTFPRQALHATKLGLMHPKTKELMTWSCSLPKDMSRLVELMPEN